MQLTEKNAVIVQSIITDIADSGFKGTVVLVSNPVDILTQVALEHTGWERKRIIGSGTVLDSARFRYLLSSKCGVDVHNVHGYILGEHGDSEFAAWSMTHIAGMPIDRYCPICGICENWSVERSRIEEQVRDSAYHIIDYKGATCYGVGQALLRITGAILRDQMSVLTVSTMLEGEYGLEDVCLSLPCLVSNNGLERILEHKLPDPEQALLHDSSAVLKNAMKQLVIKQD